MTAVRVLRVFTRDGQGGNHLGVVEDPSGLDASTMQAVAAELGFSETVFFEPNSVRIFTPTVEMPFAGHPIVGSAWVMGDGSDGASGQLNIQVGAVDYRIADGQAWVSITQPGKVHTEPESEAEHFGLPPAHRGYLVEMPLPYLVFEYDDCDTIAAATPDMDAIAAIGALVYIAAPCGALLMVLTGCLTIEEAYGSIDLKAVILIAGMLSLGLAMEQTGAAALVAERVLGSLAEYVPRWVRRPIRQTGHPLRRLYTYLASTSLSKYLTCWVNGFSISSTR